MVDQRRVIPAKLRAALLAKGALLAALAALFVWRGVEAWARRGWHTTARVIVVALAAGLALYLGWAAALALWSLLGRMSPDEE